MDHTASIRKPFLMFLQKYVYNFRAGGFITFVRIQWAYGVTCWEIFSGGKVPYSEVSAVRDIPKLLTDGYRLEKPLNDACSEEM